MNGPGGLRACPAHPAYPAYLPRAGADTDSHGPTRTGRSAAEVCKNLGGLVFVTALPKLPMRLLAVPSLSPPSKNTAFLEKGWGSGGRAGHPLASRGQSVPSSHSCSAAPVRTPPKHPAFLEKDEGPGEGKTSFHEGKRFFLPPESFPPFSENRDKKADAGGKIG